EMAMFHEALQSQDPPASREAHRAAIEEACKFARHKLTPELAAKLDIEANEDDLESTLKKTKADSAPGADGLPYEFWKAILKLSKAKQDCEPPEPNFNPIQLLTAAFRDVEIHGHCV
ncbi:hypothetical protein PENSPDRAFT_554035, partial [Peniophora sp. CONT]